MFGNLYFADENTFLKKNVSPNNEYVDQVIISDVVLNVQNFYQVQYKGFIFSQNQYHLLTINHCHILTVDWNQSII